MGLNDLILWIDVETNTTDPERGELLEVGIVASDMSGNEIGYEYHALFKTNIVDVIAKTDQFVIDMHEKSGLWKDLWIDGGKTLEEVDRELTEWAENITKDHADSEFYFGGNSITLDRSFLRLYLPNFYKKLSFRSIDVTSISLTVQSNSGIDGYTKRKKHRALKDAKDSLNEYNHYLDKLELTC